MIIRNIAGIKARYNTARRFQNLNITTFEQIYEYNVACHVRKNLTRFDLHPIIDMDSGVGLYWWRY